LRPSEEVNGQLNAAGLPTIDDGLNAMALLRWPQASYALVQALAPPAAPLSLQVAEQVEIQSKYAGYIARQQAEVERMARLESRRIPTDFDYESIPGLRNEAREQLSYYRPLTLGQASRLSGVTPADVVILMVYLDRGTPAPKVQPVTNERQPGARTEGSTRNASGHREREL
jgi:tRNA uridine 5-carboxymethylaminomethyl modification enzyme